MAITYSLAPMPKWVLIDNSGRTAGGAKLYSFSSLNPTVQKPVYQDANGTIPYPNPILFDANGTQGPFYWKSDSANPDDLYYLEAYDSNDNLLWTQNNFDGSSGGGGGGGTTYVNLHNLIPNNIFADHCGNVTTTNQTNVVLAPSNHVGFTPDSIPVIGTNGALGPDIRFIKSNTSGTDAISFVPFVNGDNPLTGDSTPYLTVRYNCTGAGTGETYKAFQFPLNAKVNTLDNQAMTFTVWAKTGSGSADIGVSIRQYFGTGASASAEVLSPKGTATLTTSWQKVTLSFITDSVGGKVLGECGDDATYLWLTLPLNQASDIYFIKPSDYLGEISPALDFNTYDEVNTAALSVRSGDVRISMNKFQPFGWIPCNDGSIGSASSGATTRANIDTFFLYKTIWDGVSNTFAPVTGGRGATSQADFAANKPLFLTKTLGRAIAGTWTPTALTFTADAGTDLLTVSSTTAYQTGNPVVVSTTGTLPSPLVVSTTYYCINVSGTTLRLATSYANAIAGAYIDITTAGTGTQTITTPHYVLGQPVGNDTHSLTDAENGPHVHGPGEGTGYRMDVGSGGDSNFVSGTQNKTVANTASSGSGQPHNIMQGTTFYNVFLKL